MIRRLINLFNRLLAGPTFFRFGDVLLPWLAVGAFLATAVGLVWGLAYAPADYQQGESFRMIYVHVPSAWMSMGAYAFMAGAAVFALVWRARLAEVVVWATAPVGAVFTALSLLTGSLWGRPMWGTWWAWDARLTSQLILLFLYLGVIGLYSAFNDQRQGARAASLLAVVGVVNLPIIHYSVVWWNSLHQGATVSFVRAESAMAAEMLWPLLIATLGAQCLFAIAVLLRSRAGLLDRERRKRWAGELVRTRQLHIARSVTVLSAVTAVVVVAWAGIMLQLPSDEAPLNYRTPLQVSRENVPLDRSFSVGGWLAMNERGHTVLRDHHGDLSVPVSGIGGLKAADSLGNPVIIQGTLAAGGGLEAQGFRALSEPRMWLTMEGYGYFVWSCIAAYLAALLGLLAHSQRLQARAAQRVRKLSGKSS